MFCFILSLAVITQSPENAAYRRQMFNYVEDLEFAKVQEKWIKDAVRPVRFRQVLTDEEVALLERLVCEHYQCRQAVMKEIRSRDGNTRMLIWGSFALDGHVKYICNVILEEKYKCDLCLGLRYCLVCRGAANWNEAVEDDFGEKTTEYMQCKKCDEGSCPRCGGLGDFRYVYDDQPGEWNPQAWAKDLRLRKLFHK